MKRRLFTILALAVILCLTFTGCSEELELDDGPDELYQYAMPEDGDEIAVIHTSMGDITVRFFPKYAPKAVKNFLTLAKQGYYDGTKFHRVIFDFMIQAGSPNGDGSSGESIYGKGFGVEATPMLHHLYGALAMANTGQPNSNNVQWYIVHNTSLGVTYLGDQLKQLQAQNNKLGYTKKVIDAYKVYGGAPCLDQSYTVFGQVIDGQDVLDRIGRIRTDANDRPVEDIVVTSIEVTTYSAD